MGAHAAASSPRHAAPRALALTRWPLLLRAQGSTARLVDAVLSVKVNPTDASEASLDVWAEALSGRTLSVEVRGDATGVSAKTINLLESQSADKVSGAILPLRAAGQAAHAHATGSMAGARWGGRAPRRTRDRPPAAASTKDLPRARQSRALPSLDAKRARVTKPIPPWRTERTPMI